MAFIRTIPVAEATGDAKALYDQAREPSGLVPNYIKAFSLRPDVYAAYQPLVRAIRSRMDLRRYELVTVATALALESSYCSLAHGEILRDKILGAEQTETFARDFRAADLTAAEKAIVAFAQKIARQASSVTQDEVEALRGHGLTDDEIFDIAAASSIRCFFSKLLDAVGAEPDHTYASMAPGLRQVLTVGREIEKTPAT